jgi:hypothetical protein
MTKSFRLAATMLLAAAAVIPFWPLFTGPAAYMDEGLLLVYPEAFIHGSVPYRDFETFYGPGNVVVLAGVFSVFGTHIYPERVVGLLYRLAIISSLFWIVRRRGVFLGLGAAILAEFFLVQTRLAASAWFGAVACFLMSLVVLGEGMSRWRCWLSGGIAAAAVIYRPDISPALIAGLLPMFLVLPRARKIQYMVGGAVVLSPLLLFLAWQARPAFENLFLYPVVYSNPGRRIPIRGVRNAVLLLLLFHVFAMAVNMVAAAVAVRKPADRLSGRILAGLVLFGLVTTYQSAQRLDESHMVYVMCISVALLPLSLFVLFNRRVADQPPDRQFGMICSLAVVALVQAVFPDYSAFIKGGLLNTVLSRPGNSFPVRHGGRLFFVDNAETARVTADVLDALDRASSPGQRLFVGPLDLRRTNYADTFIYYMMPKLVPATYFLEMNPFSANRPNSRLTSDIESADWLVLDRTWDVWPENNKSAEYGSNLPNEAVEHLFRKQGEFGSYTLFAKKTTRL